MRLQRAYKKKSLFILLIVAVGAILPVCTNSPNSGTVPAVREKGVAEKAKEYPRMLSDRWMGIYFKGSKLGFANTVVYEGDAGYRIVSRAIIRMKAMGITQETSFNQESYLDRSLRAERFVFSQDISGHRQHIKGRVAGEVLNLEISSSGATSRKTVPFGKETYLAGTMELVTQKKGLFVGNRYPLKVFMEPIQTLIDLDIAVTGMEKKKVDGEMVDVYRLKHTFKNLSTDVWMTGEGETIRETSLEGIESLKEDKERAMRFQGDPLPVSSFLTFSLVRVKKEIPEPRTTNYLRIKMSGLSDPSLIPEDNRQRILAVESVTVEGKKRYTMEIEIKSMPGGAEPKPGRDALSATPEIQSDFPEIQKLGRKIVGSETAAVKKAEKIAAWVFDYLDKKPVDTFSAVDALHSKEGECQSHTNLFAALARSTGVPTKVISGLVYSETDKGFLYHAWADVYDGQWISMDPTFGLPLSDATHIKLTEGGWEQQLNLLHFIGKVEIEVVEAR